MPQINIMILGLPLRTGLGIIALLFAMPAIIQAMTGDHSAWLAGGRGGMIHDMADTIYETILMLGEKGDAG